MFKKFIQLKLEKSVRDYFKAHPKVRLIAVVGSVGKTSTKSVLYNILKQSNRVRMHSGNHNTDISAPLAILGVDYPTSLKSVRQWMRVFKAVKSRINSPADVDVVIQELGVDRPGDMKNFTKYLKPHVSIVTAITPEHMLNFKSLDEVAREEMLISTVSDATLVNVYDTPSEFLAYISKNTALTTYGVDGFGDYSFNIESFTIEGGFRGYIDSISKSEARVKATVKVIGRHSLLPVMGAVCAANVLGEDLNRATSIASQVPAVPGRMSILRGVKQSLIIDDSYNSSPAALKSALETLFSFSGRQRVAIIGSMNELGSSSKEEHEAIGRMCTPDRLDVLITVGEEANKYIALAAKENGCVTYQSLDAMEAGTKAQGLINQGAIILAKGSEGGIFVEEAVKFIIDDKADVSQLVRQSSDWLERKQRFFKSR